MKDCVLEWRVCLQFNMMCLLMFTFQYTFNVKQSSDQSIKIYSTMKFITNKFKILQKNLTDPDFDSEHAFTFMELGFKFLGKMSID